MNAVQAMSKNTGETSPLGDRLTGHRATLRPLTGIRLFAALYIVVYHSKFSAALMAAGLPHTSYFIANGYLAVLLFFLLSGFILSYTYRSQIESPRAKRRFWEARFARIWPLYAVSLILSSFFLHSTPSAGRMAATLLMVQAWNPANVDMAGSWNFVCWTLSAEAFFYIVFPFFQTWLERRSERFQVIVMGVLLTLSIACNTGRHVFGYSLTAPFTHVPLALLRTPDFLIGVCLGNLYLNRQQKLKSDAALFPGLRLTTGLWTWIFLVLSLVLLSQPPSRFLTLTIVAFAALLFGLATEPSWPRRFLSSRLLLIGGQISYGMYLLQWPCKAVVNHTCDLLHANAVGPRFALYLVVLTLLSVAGFYLIEDPARRSIRDFFARREHVQ